MIPMVLQTTNMDINNNQHPQSGDHHDERSGIYRVQPIQDEGMPIFRHGYIKCNVFMHTCFKIIILVDTNHLL